PRPSTTLFRSPGPPRRRGGARAAPGADYGVDLALLRPPRGAFPDPLLERHLRAHAGARPGPAVGVRGRPSGAVPVAQRAVRARAFGHGAGPERADPGGSADRKSVV